jgi:hypothetical protein
MTRKFKSIHGKWAHILIKLIKELKFRLPFNIYRPDFSRKFII